MKIIGVTGGVGSGKSTVLNEIKKRYNCVLLLADDAAKELEMPGQACYKRLIALLGDDIVDEKGFIVNKKMSAKIFEDSSLLEKVNAIIHPAVKTYILDMIEAEKKKKEADYFFLEAALLIECGYKSIVDEMWYIYASDEVRRARLKASRGYTDEKIDSIMNSQLSNDEFVKASDRVIDNSEDMDKTMSQIDTILKGL